MSLAAVAVGVGAVGTIGGAYMSAQGAKSQAKAQQSLNDANQKMIEDSNMRGEIMANAQVLGFDRAIQLAQAKYGVDASYILGEDATDPTFSDQDRRLYEGWKKVKESGGRISLAQALGEEETNPAQTRLRMPWQESQNTASYKTRLTQAETEMDKLFRASGGKVGRDGLIDRKALKGLGPSINERQNTLVKEQEQKYAGFSADAKAIEDMIARYGEGERERINRESERDLTGLNRRTTAALMGKGLGAGSAMTGALTKNTLAVGEARNDALSALGDRQIQMKTAAKSDSLNLNRNLADSIYGFKLQPINTELGLATGAQNSPYLGFDPRAQVAASPGGAFGQSFGNNLSAVGGQMANLGGLALLAENNPALVAALQKTG